MTPVIKRSARDVGTCMGTCDSKADLYGRIPPRHMVYEFSVGSFRARLCQSCAEELIAGLEEAVRGKVVR